MGRFEWDTVLGDLTRGPLCWDWASSPKATGKFYILALVFNTGFM